MEFYRNKKVKLSVSDLICFVYFVSFAILETTPIRSFVMTMVCMIMGGAGLVYTIYPKVKKIHIFQLIFLFSLYVIGVGCNIFTENRNVVQLSYPFLFAGIGFLVFSHKIKSRTYFILYMLSFVLYILNYWLGGVGRDIILGQGHVSIDIYFLIIYVFMTVEKIEEGRSISIWDCLPGFFASVTDAKRMGMIVWGGIVIINLFFLFGKNEVKIRKTGIVYITFVIGVVWLALEYTTLFEQVIYRFILDGVSVEGFTASRAVIWEQYINATQEWEIITGVPIDMVPYLVHYKGNCHNLLFQCHMIYGLLGIMVFLFMIYIVCKNNIKNKRFYLMFLFLILIARSVSDYVVLGNYGDAALFYIMLFSTNQQLVRRQC